MGGGGGGRRSQGEIKHIDPEKARESARLLQELSREGFGLDTTKLQELGQRRDLSGISGLGRGELLGREEQSIESQLQAIQQAGLGQQQRISQGVRESQAARGILSSRGAIEQEAAATSQIPLEQARQRAAVFGRKGELQRQGILGAAQLEEAETQRQLGVESLLANLLGQEEAFRGQALGAAGDIFSIVSGGKKEGLGQRFGRKVSGAFGRATGGSLSERIDPGGIGGRLGIRF